MPGELLEQIAETQAEAQRALDAGDVEAWLDATHRLRRLERDRDRAWERAATKAGTRMSLPASTAREQARRALTDLGVPASLNQISAWHFARYGEEVPYKALSSLRHDERASYRRTPGGRPWYIVPALAFETLAPVRGLLAVSDWPAPDRILGPLTHRAAHLRITIAVSDAAIAHAADVPVALDRLLWRFATTVAGVRRADFDAARIRDAAVAELAQIDDVDRAEREEAASRLARLTDEQSLFGAQLKVIDGGKPRMRGRG